MAVTEAALMEYVGLEEEWADEAQRARIRAALLAAECWLVEAVGYATALDMPQGEELVLMAAGEAYEARTLTDDRLSRYAGSKAAAALNRLAFDSLAQMRLACARLVADERWRAAEERRMERHRLRSLPDPCDGEVDGPWPSETG